MSRTMSPLRRLAHRVAAAAVLLGFALTANPAAAALSCTFTSGSLNFGNIDVTQGMSFPATATVSASCSGGSASSTVRVCFSFGGGTGGVSASGAPRYLANGANTLSFELYKDAAYTTVWGSYVWNGAGGPGVELDITLNGSGAGSGSLTLYGLVTAGQQTALAGTYTSTFNSTHVETDYGTTSQGTCAALNLPNSSSTPNFTASATVISTCAVSTSAVNFGSASFLSSNFDATGSLTVDCTNQLPYNVGLGAGSGTGATVAARKMTSGANTVTYTLYSDSGRSTVWGNTIGTDTIAGTGTGGNQSLTVYGRVAPQSSKPPGTYTDTVVVTVTY